MLHQITKKRFRDKSVMSHTLLEDLMCSRLKSWIHIHTVVLKGEPRKIHCVIGIPVSLLPFRFHQESIFEFYQFFSCIINTYYQRATLGWK